MPPFGLYPIPRQHLYGRTPSSARQVFNTRDFEDDTPTPSATTKGGAVQQVKGAANADSKAREKKDKAREKRKSVDVQGRRETEKPMKAPTTPAVATTPTVSSSKGKKSKHKKEQGTTELGTSAKKRKRKSEAQADTPIATGNGSSVLDTAFLQGLKTTMGDLSTSFGQPVSATKTTEKPLKKKRKSSHKDGDVEAETEVTKDVGNGAASANKSKEDKNKTKGDSSVNLDATGSPTRTPVPVPSAKSPHTLMSKQTPVPLPSKSPSRLTGATGELQQKPPNASRKDSHVLVTETPPSQMIQTPAAFRQAPIPFSLSQTSAKPTTSRTKAKKGPTIYISSPTTTEDGQTAASAPATLSKLPDGNSGSHKSLTPSNLVRYVQPLNNEPKPRPRGRAASVAPSTASSASSMSIKEAFARVNKPSGTITNPFTVPKVAKKQHPTQNEAEMTTFTPAYLAAQKTVDFLSERAFLARHLEWEVLSTAAGPLACLHKATGCNAKREQMLRLSKEDPSPLLKVFVTTETEAHTLQDAKNRCREAEDFLARAVVAHVPVPLGQVDGIWNLFCPKYSETHVDKYGFGQRTLVLSSSTSSAATAYTAHLSIPPRSMPYTLLPFNTPPHASFRTTTLKTQPEEYEMHVIFLGNGYLLLRVDLHLLLMGKPSELGKPVFMEFIGVHEDAVQWSSSGEKV